MRTRRAGVMTTMAVVGACSMLPATADVVVGQLTRGRPPASQLNFLACPVIRDTSTVPCWLAEHDGELYYLGSQGSTSSAFYPPQLLHQVLVEAARGEGPRVCGGLPLVDVEVSVRPELDRTCNSLLPAEPAFVAPPSPPAPVPRFDDATREFRVPYDFDSDFLTLHTTRILQEVVRIAKAVPALEVHVAGRRGAVWLSDGGTLVERRDLARVRADKAAVILRGLGVAPARVHVTWDDEVAAPDGVRDREHRVVTVRLVEPVARGRER